MNHTNLTIEKLLEIANVIILTLDKDANIQLFNDFAEKITGYKKEEVINKNWFDLFIPERNGTERPKIFQDCLKEMTEVSSFENSIICKDGSEKMISWKNTVLKDENGKISGILSIGTDITKRKKAEERLKESKDKFQYVFEASNIGKSITYPSGEVHINKAFADMLGYEKKELENITWQELTPEDDIEISQKKIAPLLSGEKNSVRFTKRYFHKDGSIIWGDVSTRIRRNDEGNPLYFVTAVVDITEHKQAEEKLFESEKLMRKIADNYPNSYISIIEKDLTIGFTSGQEFKNQDINPEEFVGLKIEQVFGENTKLIRDCYKKTFKGEEQSFELFINNQYQHYRTVPLYSEDGTIQRILSVVENITERKQFMKTIQDRNEYIESIMENMPIGFALNTIDDGDVKYMNSKFEEIYGWSRDVLSNISIFFDKVFPEPEERAVIKGKIISDMQSGDSKRMRWNDLKIVTNSGEKRFVNAINIPLVNQNLMISTVQDVTDRKRAEENIIKQNDFLNSIMESLSHPFYVIDINDYSILQANSASRFGLPFNKTTCHALTHNSDVPCKSPDHQCPIDLVKRTQKPAIVEHIHYDETGNIRNVEVHCYPIFDENGDISSLIEYTLDITERKQAEKKLKESEEKHRLYFEHAPLSYQSLDEDGFILNVNPTWLKLLDYKREEVIGKWFGDFLHPEQKEVFRKLFPENIKRKDIIRDVVFLLKKRNGDYISAEYTAKIGFDDQGKFLQTHCLFQDVSERLKTETALKESEERFRNLVDTVNSGVAIYKVINEGKSGSDYIIQDFNQFALKHEKMKKEEVVGKSLKDIRPKIDEYGLIDVFRKVWKTGESTYFPAKVYIDENYSNYYENRVFRLPSGEIVAVYDDVTEREIAELALKENEAKFRSYVDSAPDGIFIANENGRYVDVNPAASKITGYSKQELLKLSIPDLLQAEFIEKGMQGFQKLPQKGLQNVDLGFVTKSGENRFWNVSAVKLSETRFLGFVKDITERKHTEEELKKHREHLEELVKERTEELQSSNKELEAFSYSVSHDLRAPLRAIDGFTGILMEDYVENLDDEGKRLGEVIQNSARKMGKLIDDLLAFSRLGRASMQFSRISMKDMAIAIYHEATNSTEQKRISFSVGELPDADGDSNMFRQVWMNLISNAVKFSSKKEKAIISITGIEDDEKITYRISDNGAGFDMRYKHKIFDVFQRLHHDRDFPGTGVGMALVRRIINRHKGNIWAESDLDKGATFYFSLPKKAK